MDQFAAIEKRFGIALPALYRTMQTEGCFTGEKYLELSDLEWLGSEDIANYEFASWQPLAIARQFVPFAISARRDEWCWRLDWAPAGGEPPVVFCERGEMGYGFAPDFRGFLYRVLLEELSGTWLLEHADDERGKQRVRRSVENVIPHLPAAWAERLQELLKRPWQQLANGTICVFPRAECKQIVEQDLPFPHLNEEFYQDPSDAE